MLKKLKYLLLLVLYTSSGFVDAKTSKHFNPYATCYAISVNMAAIANRNGDYKVKEDYSEAALDIYETYKRKYGTVSMDKFEQQIHEMIQITAPFSIQQLLTLVHDCTVKMKSGEM